MSTTIDFIQEIESLAPLERIKVIDQLIRATIKPDSEIEQIWVKEAQARWEQFESGKVGTVPYADVMSKYTDK